MAETTETASFGALTRAHLDGAVALSRAEGWPHRPEDWALILGHGRGVTARDAAGARRLLAFLFAGRAGALFRVDTPEATGSPPGTSPRLGTASP